MAFYSPSLQEQTLRDFILKERNAAIVGTFGNVSNARQILPKKNSQFGWTNSPVDAARGSAKLHAAIYV